MDKVIVMFVFVLVSCPCNVPLFVERFSVCSFDNVVVVLDDIRKSLLSSKVLPKIR